MTWLAFGLVAFLAAGWLYTGWRLAFICGERDGAEEHLARLARENAALRALAEGPALDPELLSTMERAVEQARREGRP